MKQNSVGCPITREQISPSLARLSAAITSFLLLLIYFFPAPLIPLFLLFDFGLRGFLKKTSPIKLIARGLQKILGISGKKVNAGPKIFAMKIGFWMSGGLLACSLLKWTTALFVLTSLFLFAAGMEALFNFCLGCKVFPLWQKITHWHQ
ncbi:DUF4395 domain-containing protein [Candidatus Gracilibacteria bacterium]|nr:DUF4395 domain-containing protein [Candidatus Gracilibacteria bacterium]MCF7819303.1 DUF4395 domain-containing protein [Candidatus Gracilibacteria bacterium]